MGKVDWWTRYLDRALDIIFAKYPARTGLGIVIGCALYSLTLLFEPALKAVTFAKFKDVPWWSWLPIGILIMHSPTIIALFKQRPVGDDKIDQALDLIERGNFTQAEKRQQYRKLIELVINEIALPEDAQRKINRIERNIVSTEQSSSDE